jgi:hypothetical protein
MTSGQTSEFGPGAALTRHRHCDAERGEAEAIQGRRCFSTLTGLLRRYAPRDDE